MNEILRIALVFEKKYLLFGIYECAWAKRKANMQAVGIMTPVIAISPGFIRIKAVDKRLAALTTTKTGNFLYF